MGRKTGRRFLAPHDSRLCLELVRWGMPIVRRHWALVDDVRLGQEDADRLRRAFARPGIVCPNHPSLCEPTAVWATIDRLGLRANYVMDRRTLMLTGPLQGILRGAGAYSVRRGAADRDSFVCTRRLLTEGRQIVMFPEGETYGVNDTLLPFHEGVAQLGFWGSQDRAKAGLDPDVLLTPLGVKYLYQRDMTGTIEEVLRRLEGALSLPADSALTRYERLRRVGLAALAAIEQASGIAEADDDALTLDQRLVRWYELALARLARSAGVELAPDATLQDRLRRLFGVVEEQLYDPPSEPNSYALLLRRQREPGWVAFEADLRRLQCFQAVRDGYVRSHPSAERYLDVLGRLDREVCGRRRPYGHRLAVVRVGEPIHLGGYAAQYAADRRSCVQEVTELLRQRVGSLVTALAELAPALPDGPAANLDSGCDGA